MNEVEAHTFDYYFVKQNCAYRSGELLELIADIKTTQHFTPWYAPEYIFDQIEEYRKLHPEFIKSVEYLPSDQNKLYFAFSKMPQAMQKKINHYIQSKDLSQIEQLPESDQERIYDFLIAYLNYKNIGNDKPQTKAQNQAQKKVLIQKLFGEKKMSWELALGAKPDPFTHELHRPYIRGGFGAGYDF